MSARVTGLFSYPLKSGKAISHEFAQVTWRGLQNDRLWMVMDANGSHVSQREGSKMALIATQIDEEEALILEAPGMPRIRIPDPHTQILTSHETATVHGKPVSVIDGGYAAAEWISAYMNADLTIVRINDAKKRISDQHYARPNDQVSLADSFAVLIASEDSLDAMGVPCGMDRFRPNIVIKGLKPFEEDSFNVIQIAGTVFNVVKPCTRCPMPAVNQQTGAYERETNPLPFLNKLRRGQGGELKGVFFGQNAAPSILGTIQLGDAVNVIAHKTPHDAVRYLPLHSPVMA